MYTVQEIKALTGLSVRTLHYYDEIDLLKPRDRTSAGYRLYGEEELERLQQIMFYKSLDFPLGEIRNLLEGQSDPVEVLSHQVSLLREAAKKYDALAKAAHETLTSLQGGRKMEKEKMFEALKAHEAKHEEEVEKRWGHTDAYKISKKRTAAYGPDEWAAIKQEQDDLMARIVKAMEEGVSYEDPTVMALVEEAHGQIDQYYYPCSLEVFAGLGQMYMADERFTAYYEKITPGLASYYSKAISHYVKRKES